ncbi:NADP-dependent oxidoreductase [Nevskia soli]|uniref:NADP-dependent oxidoreductase n=1 Tax=Nevskia soli TaxID=418856 RepID=UPI0004A73EC2|nr:NADP-dependent oxidoreductase [Nevskia soli]
MSNQTNKLFRLAARPVGMAKRSDFTYEEVPVAQPNDGELLVKIQYISLDPAMRGWMNAGKSYIPPVEIGAIMRAGTVGEVVASRHPQFQVGDFVSGTQGVQSYAISNGKGLVKVDPKFAPLPKYLNALGMPGITAYFGLLEVGLPKAGETVVISAASGAVGQVAGQIAKIKGCRAIGIAGGAEKCDYAVKELGYDACIDYKRGPIFPGLAQNCPEGVDIYFDNVGGDILDAVLTRLRMKARVIICGAISQYNNTTPIVGPKNYMSLLVNRARMEGMVVFDWAPRYGEAVRQLSQWMAEGRLKSREDIVEGIETFPETLLKLFSGENFGKLVLKV